MKTHFLKLHTGAALLALGFVTTLRAADPQLSSWFTANSGQYARIYQTDLARTNGTTLTTWANGNGSLSQTIPAYRGVQEVSYSSNWIYLRTTGFGQHIMGPWYDNAARSALFINMPTNQKALYSIPRTSTLTNPPATKTPTYGSVDVIGYFVDGVAMFDALDGFVWTGSTESGGGAGQWRRAAYANEYITFDTGNTHQQNSGTYHNHANPIALRFLLGDHIDQNPGTKLYSESINAVTKHSPILGWVRDGLPMYGPYGYSNPTNSASGVRRMVSGFTLRDGTKGTDNLTTGGRGTLPAWTLRGNGNTAATGPGVSTTYPLGRYLQDYSYLGDLTNSGTGAKYILGTDFDLNEWNVRYCVTPEFPGGTWAYFICIDANGTPIAPWNIGQYFFGTPTGNKVTTLTESVTTNFTGGANAALAMNRPSIIGGNVTLTWSATEGGTYRVESTTNFSNWTTNTTTATASGNIGGYTNSGASAYKFFKVTRTALANYDSGGGATTNGSGGGGATLPVPGGSVSRGNGTNITLSITLPTDHPLPPAGAPITSVTLGALTATGTSYLVQGTVLANFFISSTNALNAQNVVVTFTSPGPPPYTFTGGFTINP